MAREKASRYTSIEELLDDLEEGSAKSGRLSISQFYMRRWRRLASIPRVWLSAIALVLLVSAVVVFWPRGLPDDLATQDERAAVEPGQTSSSESVYQQEWDEAEQRFLQGDFSTAVSLFTALTQSSPEDADACHFLGRSYLELGNLKPSIENLSKAVELDSSNASHHIHLSFALEENGEYDRSIARSKKPSTWAGTGSSLLHSWRICSVNSNRRVTWPG